MTTDAITVPAGLILIALIAAVVAPIALVLVMSGVHARERQADWHRSVMLEGKLDSVHMLVNSNLTTIMQNELSALQALAALLRIPHDPYAGEPVLPVLEQSLEVLREDLENRITKD